MKNLYLLCGKVGSGKSTIAKFLSENYGVIHFSADDFMLKLFGEIEDREVFNQKLNATKDLIYEICDKLLDKNNIVLDFGFWTKQERNDLIKRFPKHNVVLIYNKINDEEILNRISKRNSNLKENEYFMDEATFRFLSSLFEEPDETEKFIIYENNQKLVKDLNL